MWITLAIFLYAFWTTIFPLTKLNLDHTPPIFLVATRMLIGGLLILLYLAIRNRSFFKIALKDWIALSILGFISVYLANVMECCGLKNLSAAKTCFIYSLSPFFSTLFSYFHFHEKVNLRKSAGILIGFLGVIPVLYTTKGSEEILSSIPFLSWPEIMVMGAVVTNTYGWVLLRKVINTVPLSMANGTSMMIGGLFALVHSLFVDPWAPIPVPHADWAIFGEVLLCMTVISNLICYNLYGVLLKRFTVTLMSFIGLFSPIFASLTSWLILGEPFSTAIIYSTGILILGLWMVYSEELKQGYLFKKPETA